MQDLAGDIGLFRQTQEMHGRRHLVERPASLAALIHSTGFDPPAVERALDDLSSEGMVEPAGDEWTIAR